MLKRPIQRIKLWTDTRDPIATDDSSKGFGRFTFWINTATNESFMCTKADVGAAVWSGSGGAGVHVAAVDPTINDDVNAGFNKGGWWLNTTTENVFQCINNAAGAAVWRNRTPFNDFHYLVGPIGKAPFQTIQAAVDQAVSDGGWDLDNQARFGIMDGDYAEDVTLNPWMNLVSVTTFAGRYEVYKLQESVKIVGKLTMAVGAGSSNDCTLIGIKVAPLSGPALVFTGNQSRRLFTFDSVFTGAADSDVIVPDAQTVGVTIITSHRTWFEAQDGYYVMQPTAPQRFFCNDSYVVARNPATGSVAIRINGGWFQFVGVGAAAFGKQIQGAIEVQAGSTGSTLVLSNGWFWRGSGVTDDVTVNAPLSTLSWFGNCTAAPYGTYNLEDMRVGGTNASDFKERPGGNAGDMRRFDGDRWNTVSTPALDGDYDIPALTTTGDFQIAMSPAITQTPEHDVLVRVNGVEYKPARDQTEKFTSPCYFSSDGGGTVTTIGSIVGAVDKLYWVGSVAGFQLAAADRIDLVYEV